MSVFRNAVRRGSLALQQLLTERDIEATYKEVHPSLESPGTINHMIVNFRVGDHLIHVEILYTFNRTARTAEPYFKVFSKTSAIWHEEPEFTFFNRYNTAVETMEGIIAQFDPLPDDPL